jgi:hypothetical protein
MLFRGIDKWSLKIKNIDQLEDIIGRVFQKIIKGKSAVKIICDAIGICHD